MTINIKYRPLKAFLLAVETGAFSHAAERLCITQPSFTALIQDLEQTLGVRLFDRTTRSIALTAAGKDFLARIQHPLDSLEEAYRNMSELANLKRGAIMLGALPSVAIRLIPPTLRRLKQQHPALKIRVVEAYNDELIMQLRTNQIEFAVGAMLQPAADLDFQPLIQDSFVAVYNPDSMASLPAPLRWQDLMSLDVVLTTQGSTPRMLFDDERRHATGSSASIYEVTHMTTAIGMVRQGLGVAVLPSLALPELDLRTLRQQALVDANAQRTLGILRRADRSLSPAAQAFMTQLDCVLQTVRTAPSGSA